MKVLELFSGTGSIRKAFEEKGHQVFSVDANPKFKADLTHDVIELKLQDIPFKPDVIWASPPCPCYSVAGFGKHWDSHGRPKTVKAVRSIGNVLATLDIIRQYKPKYYFIENPVGLLRKMPFMQDHLRVTVDYCQYGDKRRKPTDIFTNVDFNGKRCKNKATCHEKAPRGAKTGTQGLVTAEERAVIPPLFCLKIVSLCEAGYKTSKQNKIF